MFLIECPYCGPRDQAEFGYGGQAYIRRPADSEAMSDAEWAEYVFIRDNPKGPFAERWCHTAGCRRWFNMLRSTATDRVLATYRFGEPPPAVAAETPPTPSGELPGSGNDAVKLVGAPAGGEGPR